MSAAVQARAEVLGLVRFVRHGRGWKPAAFKSYEHGKKDAVYKDMNMTMAAFRKKFSPERLRLCQRDNDGKGVTYYVLPKEVVSEVLES